MRNLKYVKLFENFSNVEIKQGAYMVSGKDIESLGINSYGFVGRIGVEDDIINFIILPNNELLIHIYVKCQDAQDLLNDFKKYPDYSKSAMPTAAKKVCAGTISVSCHHEESSFMGLRHRRNSASVRIEANNRGEFNYPELYAGLLVHILKKWSEQTGDQELGIIIGSEFYNLSEISILETEKLLKNELKKAPITR